MALSNLIWWPWFGVSAGAPPPAVEFNPVGDRVPSLIRDPGPARRGRRRRREDILDEEDDLIAVIVDSL